MLNWLKSLFNNNSNQPNKVQRNLHKPLQTNRQFQSSPKYQNNASGPISRFGGNSTSHQDLSSPLNPANPLNPLNPLNPIHWSQQAGSEDEHFSGSRSRHAQEHIHHEPQETTVSNRSRNDDSYGSSTSWSSNSDSYSDSSSSYSSSCSSYSSSSDSSSSCGGGD